MKNPDNGRNVLATLLRLKDEEEITAVCYYCDITDVWGFSHDEGFVDSSKWKVIDWAEMGDFRNARQQANAQWRAKLESAEARIRELEGELERMRVQLKKPRTADQDEISQLKHEISMLAGKNARLRSLVISAYREAWDDVDGARSFKTSWGRSDTRRELENES